MADQKITELPIKGTSAINLADYLLGIDSADGYQMLISDLAKKIIEAYNGSSLGGSARTLKSALDTIATNAGNNLATIETSTTASKAYAVGDYLVMNGILYKVTTAIASGGTITVDTNVTVAAAGDDIAAIAAKIGNTTMGTTATTITGAIAEHEADISGLNQHKLGFLGDFTGNMNSIDISPGIYRLNAAGSYTITDLPGSMSDPAYCLFIQEPYFNMQVILNDSYLLIRKRTGNPPAWRSWLKLPS